MHRRSFLQSGGAAVSCPFAFALAEALADNAPSENRRRSFAIDANRVRFYADAVSKPVRVLVAADTHLFRDDDRGNHFREFSGRMAGAYNATQHFQTGEATNPETSFVQILERAQEQNVDMLALVGDIFSFPSEAAIDWVGERLAASKLPFYYVAGNHDWHYEGMAGSLNELRETWIDKRLKPLYQGKHPLMSFTMSERFVFWQSTIRTTKSFPIS